DRMLAAGHVPVLTRADLEYLEGARYGDRLEVATWFTWAPEALDAHQRIVRAGGERPLVRVSTRSRWVAAAGGGPPAVPAGGRAGRANASTRPGPRRTRPGRTWPPTRPPRRPCTRSRARSAPRWGRRASV